MVDIAEQICLAIDQVVTERLKDVKYDSTITAQVVDDRGAKDNKYICTNGSAEFIAYSENVTYKNGDSVLIIVPNNDYSQQKIIVGRYASADSKPFGYVQPFSGFINVTDNIVKTNILSPTLLANKPDQSAEIDTIYRIVSNPERYKNLYVKDGEDYVLVEVSKNSDFKNTVYYLPVQIVKKKIWSLTEEFEDKTGIKEKINIDYGGFEFVGVRGKFKSWLKSLSASAGVYGLQLAVYSNSVSNGEEKKIDEFYLSTRDMYGNPYDFQEFSEQEKLFDIKSIKSINEIELYFYQESGSFFYEDKENLDYIKIPYCTDSPFKQDFSDNLFIDSPYLSFGYSLNNFKENKAIIYTTGNEAYGLEAHRDLYIRWLHQDIDGEILTLDKSHGNLGNNNIYWYKYSPGEIGDIYGGPDWKRIDPPQTAGTLYPFRVSIDLNSNVYQEKVKAVIYTEDKQTIESNEIVFTNNSKSSAQDITDALSIYLKCKDTFDGNYCIYGQDNRLLNSANKDIVREIAIEGLKDSDNIESISWIYPVENSMIIEDSTSKGPRSSFYRINPVLTASATNNTIVCNVKVNGLSLRLVKELRFGLISADSSMTSLMLGATEGNFGLKTNSKNDVMYQLRLFDSKHNEIKIETLDESVSVKWGISCSNAGEKGKITLINSTKSGVTLHTEEGVNISNLVTLTAIMTGYLTYPIEVSIGVPIYDPVLLAADSIEVLGPREVVYNTIGYADYDKNAYQIFSSNGEIKGIVWEIFNPSEILYPGTIVNGNLLSPPSVYILKQAAYGVQAKNAQKQVLLTMPVLSVKSNRSSVVSDSSLKINGDDYRITPVVSTGSTTVEGNLQSIIIGDVDRIETDPPTEQQEPYLKNYGIYGIHDNKMAFAIKEDGNVVIGKAGDGTTARADRLKYNPNSRELELLGGNLVKVVITNSDIRGDEKNHTTISKCDISESNILDSKISINDGAWDNTQNLGFYLGLNGFTTPNNSLQVAAADGAITLDSRKISVLNELGEKVTFKKYIEDIVTKIINENKPSQ